MTEGVLERLDVEVGFDDAEDERPHDEKRPPEEKEDHERRALALRKRGWPAPVIDRQSSSDERGPPDKAGECHAGQQAQEEWPARGVFHDQRVNQRAAVAEGIDRNKPGHSPINGGRARQDVYEDFSRSLLGHRLGGDWSARRFSVADRWECRGAEDRWRE